MRLTIAAVGRMKSGAPEEALTETYLERAAGLGPKLGFSKLTLAVVETSGSSSASARMAEEAKRLLSKIPEGAFIVALDEAGRTFTSEAFAKYLAVQRDRSTRDLAFVIGGPDGLDETLQKSAALKLAFGPQTWPHLLVRTMLTEQIYRALAILAGHPYHRSKAPTAR